MKLLLIDDHWKRSAVLADKFTELTTDSTAYVGYNIGKAAIDAVLADYEEVVFICINGPTIVRSSDLANAIARRTKAVETIICSCWSHEDISARAADNLETIGDYHYANGVKGAPGQLIDGLIKEFQQKYGVSPPSLI